MLALCAIFLIACNRKHSPVETNSAPNKAEVNVESSSKSYGFVATGDDNDWKIVMNFVNHTFTFSVASNESASLQLDLPTVAKPFGENGVKYAMPTNTGEMVVTIVPSEKSTCDADVQYEKVYTIALTYFDGSGSELASKKGCGTYLENYNLNDIWVLQSIDGVEIDKIEKQPYLEFNLREGKVFGFVGCNRVSGNALYYKNAVQFPMLAATKMACPDLDLEQKFLQSLNEGPFYVDYKENTLVLRNEKHSMAFRKGD